MFLFCFKKIESSNPNRPRLTGNSRKSRAMSLISFANSNVVAAAANDNQQQQSPKVTSKKPPKHHHWRQTNSATTVTAGRGSSGGETPPPKTQHRCRKIMRHLRRNASNRTLTEMLLMAGSSCSLAPVDISNEKRQKSRTAAGGGGGSAAAGSPSQLKKRVQNR